MSERTCEWCGALYTPKRRDQRMCGGYCSTRSPEARAKPRDPINCQQCQKPFTPAHSAHKYCSRACGAKAYRGPRFTERRTCTWCGAEYMATQATAKYCSRTCKSSATARAWIDRYPGGSREYWRQVNRRPGRVQYQLAWSRAHAHEIREAARRRAAADPERARRAFANYRAANRDYFRQREALRRAARRSGRRGDVPIRQRDWLRLVRRWAFRCAYCGCRPDRLEIEHVVPISRGGRHGIGNALPACPPCNQSKGALTVMEWRAREAEAAKRRMVSAA